jgi:hypothetical protein
MTKDYIVLDLVKVHRELGSHVGSEDAWAWCPCGNAVEQRDWKCTECGMRIVWKGSEIWRRLYGTPGQAIKKLEAIMPKDRAGQYLMERAKLPGFFGEAEHKRWLALVEALSQQALIATTEYCARKTSKRGLVKYTLNAAEKKAGELPPADDGLGVIG